MCVCCTFLNSEIPFSAQLLWKALFSNSLLSSPLASHCSKSSFSTSPPSPFTSPVFFFFLSFLYAFCPPLLFIFSFYASFHRSEIKTLTGALCIRNMRHRFLRRSFSTAEFLFSLLFALAGPIYTPLYLFYSSFFLVDRSETWEWSGNRSKTRGNWGVWRRPSNKKEIWFYLPSFLFYR